jgi:hypothetical protein
LLQPNDSNGSDKRGEDAGAKHDIKNGKDPRHVLGWRKITVTHGCERDGAEVEGVEPAPAFDEVIEDAACDESSKRRDQETTEHGVSKEEGGRLIERPQHPRDL